MQSKAVLLRVCKNLDEEYEKLGRECGAIENTLSTCGFHNGEFCAIMIFPDSYFDNIFDKCYNVSDRVCSTNCRNVWGEFIDRVGCCFHYFNRSYFYDDPELSSDLFSACDIEVPDSLMPATVSTVGLFLMIFWNVLVVPLKQHYQ